MGDHILFVDEHDTRSLKQRLAELDELLWDPEGLHVKTRLAARKERARIVRELTARGELD